MEREQAAAEALARRGSPLRGVASTSTVVARTAASETDAGSNIIIITTLNPRLREDADRRVIQDAYPKVCFGDTCYSRWSSRSMR